MMIGSSFVRAVAAAALAACTASAGAQASAPAANARIAAAPATPNAVVVAGTVPDEATRQAILQRTREIYGADRVVDQLAIGPVVAPPNWSGYVQRLIGPGLKQVSRGQLAISGNTVDLKGEVGNEALRQQVVSDMSTQLNPTYTVRNGLRVASNEQGVIDNALANRIVEFESGSATLTPRGVAVLDEVLNAMKTLPPGRKVQVIGHTDNLGSRDANIALAAARADSVKAYLVAKAMPADMIEPSGAGPDRPVASNATPDGRARNRRIEFRVSQ
jgi:OmpA-OmpF porin, OOP family